MHSAIQNSGNPEPSGRSLLWIRLFWIGIAAVYALLFAVFFNRVWLNDNDQFLMFHELQFWNARLFGFAKQWSPVMVGGISLAGDPQVPLLSLSMMLSYLLGPFYGLRVAAILYFMAGWTGAWLYSGLVWKRFEWRALAASLFIGNGFFVCRMAHGHIDHIPFLALPLVLWFLHRLADALPRLPVFQRLLAAVAAVLALGGAFSVIVDGSPVAIIHWLFWIAVYALALAAAKRSWIPALIPALAVAAAAVLGAGYLWPMLVEQQAFPRMTPDTATNPLSLLWFMLLPFGGRVIPAPANGHEYSVYIGPVLAWLILKYRREIAAQIPREARGPLLAASLVSLVMGMGSLHALGVPAWLSPFDWVRPLPGFRSINVTGRYWGFLALPLSLMAAAAVVRYLQSGARRAGWWLGLALVLQAGFMAAFVGRSSALSIPYRPVPYQGLFPPGGADIVYEKGGPQIYQYNLISPVRGLLDAYNMGDFIHPDMDPGALLIRGSFLDGKAGIRTSQWMKARFINWNRIRIQYLKPLPPAVLEKAGILTLTFNQAWHRNWSCEEGAVYTQNGRNMAVDIPTRRITGKPIDLVFYDPASEAGARVSAAAWRAWALLMLMLAGLAAASKAASMWAGSLRKRPGARFTPRI